MDQLKARKVFPKCKCMLTSLHFLFAQAKIAIDAEMKNSDGLRFNWKVANEVEEPVEES